MKDLFRLTRGEQRVVIFIVVILVLAAFTQHFLDTKSKPLPARSTSSPTASPTVRPESESDNDDSR
ncbi:MAG TPA: hypothetical protein VH170_00775 [Chthoniobacterales bacterium]|nr:hypothetical protein [Chthoniobacterales bacterium]